MYFCILASADATLSAETSGTKADVQSADG